LVGMDQTNTNFVALSPQANYTDTSQLFLRLVIGLFSQPLVINVDDCGAKSGVNDSQGSRKSSANTSPSAALCTTIPTRLNSGSNPDRLAEKPAINRLCYGTATSVVSSRFAGSHLCLSFTDAHLFVALRFIDGHARPERSCKLQDVLPASSASQQDHRCPKIHRNSRTDNLKIT
jgi:hypothetical protein